MMPFMLLLLIGLCAAFAMAGDLSLTLRRRQESAPGSGEYVEFTKSALWKPDETAFLVCDMWDKHWCAGASNRVDELAPQMNRVLQAARAVGVLILHAPSDTMEFYEGTPQRERARSAPPAAAAPADIAQWRPLDTNREPPLPIDDSDGGCDDQPPCPTYRAWSRQHPAIEIASEDAISDSGVEVYNLLEQRGITCIAVMGVHTNMCVLGRPFGIRRLVSLGKEVVLMRDMTDTMYNPAMSPYISHFEGTERVIRHIETFWCSTITSDQIVGGEPFRFRDSTLQS